MLTDGDRRRLRADCLRIWRDKPDEPLRAVLRRLLPTVWLRDTEHPERLGRRREARYVDAVATIALARRDVLEPARDGASRRLRELADAMRLDADDARASACETGGAAPEEDRVRGAVGSVSTRPARVIATARRTKPNEPKAWLRNLTRRA